MGVDKFISSNVEDTVYISLECLVTPRVNRVTIHIWYKIWGHCNEIS